MERSADRILDRVGCGILVFDQAGRVTFANRAAETLLGLTRGRLLDLGCEGLEAQLRTTEGQPLERNRSPFTRVLERGETVQEELAVNRPDGSRRFLRFNAAPAPEGGQADFFDLTERFLQAKDDLQARQELQASEARLVALIRHLDEIVFEFSADGTYLNIWTIDEQLLRRRREELLGRTIEEVLGSSAWECFGNVFRRALATGRPQTFEYPLEVLGGPRWFLARVAPIPSPGGGPATLSFFARDITERKRIEEELRTSEERFHQILENIRLAALVLDGEGRVIFCNGFLLDLMGRQRMEVEGKDWFEQCLPPGDRKRVQELWKETLHSSRTAHYLEYPVLTRDGKRRLIAWNSLLQRDAAGKPLLSASIGEDITERRLAEEILRRSNQMKSEFISTAAHELRTPLTTVMGYAEVLLNPGQFGGFTPEQEKEFLREIYAKAEILTGIINELLDLTRLEAGRSIPLQLTPCSLDDVLSQEVRQFSARFPGRRFVLKQEDRCPPEILIDRNRMEQVLENLMSNAVKYSPEGTSITISAGRENSSYRVSVADQGIGMSPEEVEQIFDIFYRTDASDTASRGIGLGLCLVRGIIEAHGGRISVDSSPGRGTTVSFTLPIKIGRPEHGAGS